MSERDDVPIIGALIFIRHSTSYGVLMPLYRHRSFRKNMALVFADADDATRYAAANNLLPMHSAERAK